MAHLAFSGRPAFFATIVADDGEGTAGLVRSWNRPAKWLRAEKRRDPANAFILVHRKVRAAMAGFAAESVGFGLELRRISPYRYRGTLDLDGAIESIRAVYTPRAPRAHVEGMISWILKSEYLRARAFLKANWGAVRAVARALLEHRTLRSGRLRALYARLAPRLRVPVYRLGPFRDDARFKPGDLPVRVYVPKPQ